MRIVLTSLVLLGAASPAAAQSHRAPQAKPTAEAAVGALQNPFVQEVLTQALLNAADAVLATRVGPLARYADPDGEIGAEDTIGDIQRRRNPAFDQRLRDGTRGAVTATARLGRDAVTMSHELQATGDRLRAALAPLASAARAYSDDN